MKLFCSVPSLFIKFCVRKSDAFLIEPNVAVEAFSHRGFDRLEAEAMNGPRVDLRGV